jgi:basic membrane protein A and related proteins
MRKSRLATLALLAAVLLGTIAIAGCGSGSASGSASGSGSGKANAAGEPLKVGFVATTDGINDRSFGQLGAEGMKEAEEKLGIEGRIFTPTTSADYIPDLAAAAREGDQLVIGEDFELAEAMGTIAAQYPETHFAIVDISQKEVPGNPQNVLGLVFKQEEAGYLAGYAAGLWAKENGAKTVSGVGGQEIPPVVSYLAGYDAGAKAAFPTVEAINGFSEEFVDPAKCKEVALEQISRGSKVVFAVAGNCGLGAVDAAGEEGVEAIGVDADQSYLGPQILTSALKKVNVAVVDTIEEVESGRFKGGADHVFDLENNGVGVGKFAAGTTSIQKAVEKVKAEIVAGKGPAIPSTLGGE